MKYYSAELLSDGYPKGQEKSVLPSSTCQQEDLRSCYWTYPRTLRKWDLWEENVKKVDSKEGTFER